MMENKCFNGDEIVLVSINNIIDTKEVRHIEFANNMSVQIIKNHIIRVFRNFKWIEIKATQVKIGDYYPAKLSTIPHRIGSDDLLIIK